MGTWAQGTARAVVLTASFVALGAGTVFPTSAFADTSGNGSLLGGNQANAPVSVPINISGNSVAVAGESSAHSKGGSSVHTGGGKGVGKTSGKHSIGGGNQVSAPISAPLNACGNSVAIFGTADAGCKGGASVTNGGKGGGKGGGKTSGKGSVLGGNQVTAPLSAPIDACGNAVALFGSSDAGCKGGATATNSGGGLYGDKTTGKHGAVAGNQVYAPADVPVNICGNAAGTFGEAVSGCKGGATSHNGGGKGSLQTSGKNAAVSGNQLTAPVSAPINVCGNAVGHAYAECKGGAMVHNGGTVPHKTSGKEGAVSGNQLYAPVGAPVNACGNASGVLGESAAGCHGGSSMTTTPGDPTTSGKHAIGSGNQAYVPITAPSEVCGNATAVLAEAAAGCVGGVHANGSGAPNLITSGKHGAGSGNQAVAQAKAPVDVCGNVTAVLGDADPGCGAANGHSRVERKPGVPTDMGLPVLPTVPGMSQAGSAVPGTAVPAMPELLPQVPAGLPVGQRMPTDGTGTLPVQTPKLPGQAPAGLPQLPVGRSKLGTVTPQDQLVGTLPVALPVAGVAGQRQAVPTQGTAALPGLTELPVVGGSDAPSLVNSHLKGPEAAPKIGWVTEKAGAVQQQVGAMRPASDTQPVAGGMSGASLYVLVIGTLLAGVAAAGGVFRRLRQR